MNDMKTTGDTILPYRRRSKWKSLLPLLLTCSLIGCAARPITPVTDELAHHILMANSSGEPEYPSARGSPRVLCRTEYNRYIEDMLVAIARYCQSHHPCKILIFFHGGLNSETDTTKRAANLYQTIMKDGSYPIFVNWESGFISSYRDHLLRVYKGINEPKLAWAAPFQFGMDEASSIAETPAAWFAELRHTFPTLIETQGKGWQAAMTSYRSLVDETQSSPIDINNLFKRSADPIMDDRDLLDDRQPGERVRKNVTLAATVPTKLLAPPLVIQAFGRGAWDVMYRRTATLMLTEKQLNGATVVKDCDASDNPDEHVALLGCFITHYTEFVRRFCPQSDHSLSGCRDLQLTLVGHSMGTIVIDQWLRRAPTLEISNIVFMAGATTVSDYRDTVVAYLLRQRERISLARGKGQVLDVVEPTSVYHLVLHPMAEITETGLWDLAPRGSLLVWIDNYFSRPVTPLDRTVGRFFNLMPELARTPTELRGQIHTKIFRVGSTIAYTDPQRHHDFSVFPFWNPEFWNPSATVKPTHCKNDWCSDSEPAASGAAPGPVQVPCPNIPDVAVGSNLQ
jgi:hypothetical protein